MRLSDEEKRMLDGEFGEAFQYSMQILFKVGNMYGADRLVEIASAHVGIAYPEFLASVELIESFVNKGGKFKVLTTVNSGHWPGNFSRWPDLPEPPKYLQRAERIINAIEKNGWNSNLQLYALFTGESSPIWPECGLG